MKTAFSLSPDVLAALEEMRAEFESSCLEVVLIPQRIRTNEGGCIRVCASKNATWYQRFCARYSSSRFRKKRAFDTRIKRANTSRVLAALCECRATASQYAEDFLAEAHRRIRANPAIYALALAHNEDPF